MSVSGHPGSDASRLRRAVDFREAFLRSVHVILAEGYCRLEPGGLCAADEETITGKLVESIEGWLDDAAAPPWVDPYSVREEERVHSDDVSGKARRRIDISFQCGGPRPRPRFRFEAKRLGPGHSVGNYLGPDGMGAFLDGTYARDDPEAGMLGYLQSETPDHWHGKIASALADAPEQYRFFPGDRPIPRTFDNRLGETRRTDHDRQPPLKAITIFHTLLSMS